MQLVVKGVTYNVPLHLSEQEVLAGMKERTVIAFKCMGKRENGRGSTPVLLTFKDGFLQRKIMLGYRRCTVKEYESVPVVRLNEQTLWQNTEMQGRQKVLFIYNVWIIHTG